MAKADKIKEEIGRLRLIIGLSAVVYVSLVAWIAQNYLKHWMIELGNFNIPAILIGAVLILILVTFLLIFSDMAVRRKIEELEKGDEHGDH